MKHEILLETCGGLDGRRALLLLRVEAMARERLDRPLGPDDHAIGPLDAPIVLIEYGDYTCPDCARARPIVASALEALGDRVRYAFRNFPHTDINADAGRAAEAAESVAVHGGEEAFWDMHAMLFANQDAMDVDDLLGYAEACGVDVAAVADDLSTGAMGPHVRADFESGARAGVNDTPAFYVNAICYEDDWSDEPSFIAALREAASAVGRH